MNKTSQSRVLSWFTTPQFPQRAPDNQTVTYTYTQFGPQKRKLKSVRQILVANTSAYPILWRRTHKDFPSEDTDLIPGSGRSPGGGGEWQPTPVFLPRKSQGRGTSRNTVQWVTKSQTQLSQWYNKAIQM